MLRGRGSPSSASRNGICPAVALMLACLLAGWGCAPDPDPPRNLLLVSVDTLRADRLGCYGHAEAGTPALDTVAEQGVLFEDVTAPVPLTLPTHATLLTGQLPPRHGVRHNGLFALPETIPTLAEAFEDAGFRTGGFVASIVMARRHGLARGFQAWTQPGDGAGAGTFLLQERPAPQVNADALAWLDAGPRDRPFFLFVHYMEPHYPYAAPEPERSRFADDPYQGEVAAADRALGGLLRALQERGLLEETLVAVVSDHGEDLGDHGEQTHGLFLYQSTLHVPLLMAGPGLPRGRRIREPVGLVDLAPTLAEAFGLTGLRAADGMSLWAAAAHGESLPEDRALYAETLAPRYDYALSDLRALRRGPWKYIAAPRSELYNLDEDPGETRNFRYRSQDRSRTMERALRERLEVLDREGEEAAQVQLTESDREALASLGYVSGGTPAEGDLPDPKDGLQDVLLLDRAGWLVRHDRPAEAEEILNDLIRRRPRLLEARLRLVVALLQQGRREEARQVGRSLEEVAEDGPQADRLAARVHLLLAESWILEGNLPAAAEAYEQALAVPQSVRVHLALAALYADLGRLESGIRVLEDLERAGRADGEVRRLLKLLQARRVGGP